MHFPYRWNQGEKLRMEWPELVLCVIPGPTVYLNFNFLSRRNNSFKVKLLNQSIPALYQNSMVPHSSTFAWKIPWIEKPGRLQSMGSLESDMTERLHFHFSLSCTGERNGNPLQCSCLENPRDREAWYAAVYGVTQSRTRLKRLSSLYQNFVI